ncbi:MAG TPA: hypothetical protein PLE19_03435 [Planctomycetota bacterium]|nr:hypothetical protein [Planctomycetota bacterium]HRR79596.1 hypothetical protein [Planctomycetota bacterium]HRT95027.1 hypothetical protein [Planctomycetota bacterium]
MVATRLVRLALLFGAVLCAGAGCARVARHGPDGPIISWRDAAKHTGQFVTVEGTIVRTRNTGKACFLNFHPNWRETLAAVIFARNFGAFPPEPEKHYRGKSVRIRGVIVEYEGRPEIILESPDDIEVLP